MIRHSIGVVVLQCLSIPLAIAQPAIIGTTSVPDAPVAQEATITVSCTVEQRAGSSAVERVALTIRHPERTAQFPRLYDDGTHGDALAGDAVYSLRFAAPTTLGTHEAVCTVIDRAGVEVEAAPATFEVR